MQPAGDIILAPERKPREIKKSRTQCPVSHQRNPPVSRERKLEDEEDDTAERHREPTTSTIYELAKEGEGLTT